MNFQLQSKITLLENEPLTRHTTFRIGGCARFFASPRNEDELSAIYDFARHADCAVYVIGNGSNVLFPDAGFPGLVISLKAFNQDKMVWGKDTVTCSAGVMLAHLVEAAQQKSYGGLEFMVGITGTVGGAIKQNASFKGQAVSDIVERISVFDHATHAPKSYDRRNLEFSYRACPNLSGIVVEAVFKIKVRPQQEIERDIQANNQYRRDRHDLGYPSAGCIFKNPSAGEYTAGQLIDLCGLKGTAMGGAKVSERHANYIINYNQASAEDVLSLIEKVRRVVKKRYGTDLTLEIKYVG